MIEAQNFWVLPVRVVIEEPLIELDDALFHSDERSDNVSFRVQLIIAPVAKTINSSTDADKMCIRKLLKIIKEE